MTNKNLAIIVGVIVLVVAVGAFMFQGNGDPEGEQTQNETLLYGNENNSQDTVPNAPEGQQGEQNESTNTTTPMTTEKQKAEMQVKGFGKIVIELDAQSAPKTVANFVKLANEGFYNNLTFHRIAKGFVVQGGDPKGDGTGGPGYNVPAEIKLAHKRGSIATARLGDDANPTRESSGSQFYIALDDLPTLDGQYTVFGQVVEGMDVVDKIASVEIDPGPFGGSDGSPKTPVVIESVKIVK